jgi:N-acetylmuramoyl-L-alanine amidase
MPCCPSCVDSLNFTNSKESLEVAARENASSQKAVYELRALLQRIALQDKIDESRQFAAKIQQALYSSSARVNSRTRDRGVKKAPFVVLIGASMPSVLAEIGFISNPKDESLFMKTEFRQRIAEGLYKRLSQYAAKLSQAHLAKN